MVVACTAVLVPEATPHGSPDGFLLESGGSGDGASFGGAVGGTVEGPARAPGAASPAGPGTGPEAFCIGTSMGSVPSDSRSSQAEWCTQAGVHIAHRGDAMAFMETTFEGELATAESRGTEDSEDMQEILQAAQALRLEASRLGRTIREWVEHGVHSRSATGLSRSSSSGTLPPPPAEAAQSLREEGDCLEARLCAGGDWDPHGAAAFAVAEATAAAAAAAAACEGAWRIYGELDRLRSTTMKEYADVEAKPAAAMPSRSYVPSASSASAPPFASQTSEFVPISQHRQGPTSGAGATDGSACMSGDHNSPVPWDQERQRLHQERRRLQDDTLLLEAEKTQLELARRWELQRGQRGVQAPASPSSRQTWMPEPVAWEPVARQLVAREPVAWEQPLHQPPPPPLPATVQAATASPAAAGCMAATAPAAAWQPLPQGLCRPRRPMVPNVAHLGGIPFVACSASGLPLQPKTTVWGPGPGSVAMRSTSPTVPPRRSASPVVVPYRRSVSPPSFAHAWTGSRQPLPIRSVSPFAFARPAPPPQCMPCAVPCTAQRFVSGQLVAQPPPGPFQVQLVAASANAAQANDQV